MDRVYDGHNKISTISGFFILFNNRVSLEKNSEIIKITRNIKIPRRIL